MELCPTAFASLLPSDKDFARWGGGEWEARDEADVDAADTVAEEEVDMVEPSPPAMTTVLECEGPVSGWCWEEADDGRGW